MVREPNGRSDAPARQAESLVRRFPSAAVAFDRELRIVAANGKAQTLLGPDRVRVNTDFSDAGPRALRALATRLNQMEMPLTATKVELDDGRLLRVSGIAATAEQPAVMFLEDLTEEHRDERVMSDFLRNAAHQLRTPLAGVMAAVEMLQAGAKERPADRDRFLEHIERHGDRLTRVARGLLTLARVQTGEGVALELVALQPLLETIAAAVEPRQGVTLRLECPPELAALANADLLHEALAAVVDNAVGHTHEGEIRLTASQTGDTVAVSVSDTGQGIPAELRERIFEPFFRIAYSHDEGYGLGLAIVARAVDAMAGQIAVDDAPGGGTLFTITLRSAKVIR